MRYGKAIQFILKLAFFDLELDEKKIASSKMGRVRLLVGKFDDSARTEPQKSVLSTPHGNCEPSQNGIKFFLKEHSYFYFSSAF